MKKYYCSLAVRSSLGGQENPAFPGVSEVFVAKSSSTVQNLPATCEPQALRCRQGVQSVCNPPAPAMHGGGFTKVHGFPRRGYGECRTVRCFQPSSTSSLSPSKWSIADPAWANHLGHTPAAPVAQIPCGHRAWMVPAGVDGEPSFTELGTFVGSSKRGDHQILEEGRNLLKDRIFPDVEATGYNQQSGDLHFGQVTTANNYDRELRPWGIGHPTNKVRGVSQLNTQYQNVPTGTNHLKEWQDVQPPVEQNVCSGRAISVDQHNAEHLCYESTSPRFSDHYVFASDRSQYGHQFADNITPRKEEPTSFQHVGIGIAETDTFAQDSGLSKDGTSSHVQNYHEFIDYLVAAVKERRTEKCPEPVTSAKPTGNFCYICGKTYARPSTLKTHMRTHSGERPYQCKECKKAFSQSANLAAHFRTHTGEKPYKCLVCDRRFSQSSSVTTHLRTHSGERPYVCSYCRRAFTDSSTLTKHSRIHTGQRPYKCRICPLKFSQSGNLNRHMKVHAAKVEAAEKRMNELVLGTASVFGEN